MSENTTTIWSERDLRRVEEISQNASRPERGVMIDGWSVGLSPSKAKRSRCVNPFYASARSFDENLAAVRAQYAQAKLPCVFRLTRWISDPTLDERLAAMGAEAFDTTHVQLCDLNANFERRVSGFTVNFDMSIEKRSSPSSIGDIVQKLRGDSAEEIAALVERWRTLPLTIQSYTAYDQHGVAASHVLTIAEEHCVGVFDVVTRDTHRGRGFASALIVRALTDARANGATIAYLQVMTTNPAVKVYERLGFTTAYDYWYRTVGDV